MRTARRMVGMVGVVGLSLGLMGAGAAATRLFPPRHRSAACAQDSKLAYILAPSLRESQQTFARRIGKMSWENIASLLYSAKSNTLSPATLLRQANCDVKKPGDLMSTPLLTLRINDLPGSLSIALPPQLEPYRQKNTPPVASVNPDTGSPPSPLQPNLPTTPMNTGKEPIARLTVQRATAERQAAPPLPPVPAAVAPAAPAVPPIVFGSSSSQP